MTAALRAEQVEVTNDPDVVTRDFEVLAHGR